MARSRSSRPAPSRAPARAPSRSVPAAPQRSAPPAPQQSQQSGGMMSGFASTIAQGFAFGTGSAVAHRAVGAAAGAFSGDSEAPQHHETHPQQVMQQQQHAYGAPAGQQACSLDGQNFQACLQANPGNVDACTFLYEALQQCQRNSQFQ
ncbi:Hypothetical protein NocV09_00302150 [Nannochloropsis oceanica]